MVQVLGLQLENTKLILVIGIQLILGMPFQVEVSIPLFQVHSFQGGVTISLAYPDSKGDRELGIGTGVGLSASAIIGSTVYICNINKI